MLRSEVESHCCSFNWGVQQTVVEVSLCNTLSLKKKRRCSVRSTGRWVQHLQWYGWCTSILWWRQTDRVLYWLLLGVPPGNCHEQEEGSRLNGQARRGWLSTGLETPCCLLNFPLWVASCTTKTRYLWYAIRTCKCGKAQRAWAGIEPQSPRLKAICTNHSAKGVSPSGYD